MNELSCSNINNIDILVIGAGPVGLTTALWFAKHNYNTVLIEQYSEIKKPTKRPFNERHQQIGLDPDSLNFIKDLDVVVWGEIKLRGCPDEDWINIPIYTLQNILLKELRNHIKVTILFDTLIESVIRYHPESNCRLVMTRNTSDTLIYGISPKLIVVADGKHDDSGTAKQFFNFSPACKVHLSTYGIVGLIERNISDDGGSICLKNYSSDFYVSDNYKEIGPMYIRLLGSMKERYIALGLGDNNNVEEFKSLNPIQIKELLIESYNRMRDITMGEPEIDESGLTIFSNTPIPIFLDYRKETIKLLEGSSTIVSIEGDAARKTTFFSGSGLNSGYKALSKLFKFCQENNFFVLNKSANPNHILTIDQKLLEKDRECMHISLELLIKGKSYIGNKNQYRLSPNTPIPLSSSQSSISFREFPVIHSISPNKGEVPWFIQINGNNLIGTGGKSPTCILEWMNGSFSTDNVIVYDSNTVGVKIPRQAEGAVSIKLKRYDGEIAVSPEHFLVMTITKVPVITDVYREDTWLRIEGKYFKKPSHVIIDNTETIKAYCNSVNSLIFTPNNQLVGKVNLVVQTDNGLSQEYIIDFDSLLRNSS